MNKTSKQKALNYIYDHWPYLMTCSTKESGSYIELPHPFVSPSGGQFHCDQFYWDSYFIILGLLHYEDYIDIARGMVDNLVFMFDTYGLVPMRNRSYDTGISQPPLLTSMAREVYKKTQDKAWLQKVMLTAEKELNSYWMNEDPSDHVVDHLVFEKLSRYADHHLIDQTAEHESGWDMTSRFNNVALQYIPIDLSCLLNKYELDLAWFYSLTDTKEKSEVYRLRAEARSKTIRTYLKAEDGFFYDYNYIHTQQSSFKSLAGFMPLFGGVATNEEAQLLAEHLNDFEHAGGLATTLNKNLLAPYKQWDYPNGWAPLHWFIIEGLRNYELHEQAGRIASKWLNLNLEVFNSTGKFWEKYDVVNQTVGKPGRYPNQHGFGWTNGVFVELANTFI